MGIYGNGAVGAKHLILESGQSTAKAWELVIAEFTQSSSSRTKGCPKGAFLGLCEAGVIAGIPGGVDDELISNKNGRYALVAWAVLQSEPNLSEDKEALWHHVRTREIHAPQK